MLRYYLPPSRLRMLLGKLNRQEERCAEEGAAVMLLLHHWIFLLPWFMVTQEPTNKANVKLELRKRTTTEQGVTRGDLEIREIAPSK